MEKNLKRNMYVKPNHFAIHVKLTQFCKKKKKIYILLFGCARSLLLHTGFSLVAASEGSSGVAVRRMSLVAPWHVDSSPTRD